MQTITDTLYDAFGQRQISTIYAQANQYRVVLEHNTENTPGLAALDSVRLTSKDGGIVPLSAIATVEERHAPLSINHLDQFPSTTISFNVPNDPRYAGKESMTWSEAADLPLKDVALAARRLARAGLVHRDGHAWTQSYEQSRPVAELAIGISSPAIR